MKPILAALLAGAAVLAVAAQASAADTAIEKRLTPAFQTCEESPEGQSTMGMIGCIGDELTIQDKALNTAYRKAMDGLTPGEKTRLQAAQRAWIAFRDADCAALDDPEQWGTISRINANWCMLDRTVERTIELENFPPDEAGPAG